MSRLWRVLRPWLAVAASLGLLIAIEARWSPQDAPQSPTQEVRAGLPFMEHDPGGASLVCISSRAGRVLPPYLTAP